MDFDFPTGGDNNNNNNNNNEDGIQVEDQNIGDNNFQPQMNYDPFGGSNNQANFWGGESQSNVNVFGATTGSVHMDGGFAALEIVSIYF
jgi:hypothetical protein